MGATAGDGLFFGEKKGTFRGGVSRGVRMRPLSLARASALLRSVVRSSSGLRARVGSVRIVARLLRRRAPASRAVAVRASPPFSLSPSLVSPCVLAPRPQAAPRAPTPQKEPFFLQKTSHRQPPPPFGGVKFFPYICPRNV